MSNSVLTQIKVKEVKPEVQEPQETSPQTWEIKQPEPQNRNAVTFTHTFESRDQAVAICRILAHQTDLLKKEAAENREGQLPYLSDILGDYSAILEKMLQKIESATNR